jgi:hypothetical protein
MTAVEAELEQAKLTISNLKDTQMRQEIILRQYAEEVCSVGCVCAWRRGLQGAPAAGFLVF